MLPSYDQKGICVMLLWHHMNNQFSTNHSPDCWTPNVNPSLNQYFHEGFSKGLSKEDPVNAFIHCQLVDYSTFLTGLPCSSPLLNLLSTWQPEDLPERQSDHVTFLFKSSRGLSCHSQKAHSPYPGVQGSLCRGCQLTLWFHLHPLPFLLTYFALATLASMLFLIQTCSSQSSLLKLFCPLLFAWLASSLQVSSQMISRERRLPDHPIANSSPTLLPIVSIPLFCSMSPQSTYIFGMLHLLLWMAPYWSVSSVRKQTRCLFYMFLCPQLSA